ncbi:hypothetical protein [Flavilitoribacter nigricans]|uniref:Uncharacterized protein n=1 Tax=Flavilitoribacter nigricans (strain ATCC 23147 / DSM 23189 / NBRC 102662 / NCIMB 1420 / SS-2) TaxID=1122177 RepID=A0A2D0NJR9_FLAN2|nr:hypothetical protein [Flavilitoribacter nigricans]PHN08449.1 hypothetical protein CRP01_00620 [Flavilitoribacter nigricans DSM 23189 = NBRC 102662]
MFFGPARPIVGFPIPLWVQDGNFGAGDYNAAIKLSIILHFYTVQFPHINFLLIINKLQILSIEFPQIIRDFNQNNPPNIPRALIIFHFHPKIRFLPRYLGLSPSPAIMTPHFIVRKEKTIQP